MNMPSRSVPKALAAVCSACAIITSMAGCNSLTQTTRYDGNVVATESANVTGCKYLGEINGNSGLTGLFAPKGVDNVRQSLLKQADAMGATHIVWAPSSALLDNTSLSGQAYTCTKAAK